VKAAASVSHLQQPLRLHRLVVRMNAGQAGPVIGIFVALLVAWEYGVRLFGIKAYILPPPSQIWVSLSAQLATPVFWQDAGVTLKETLAGYALAIVGAFVIGILVAEFRLVGQIVMPYVVAFQSVPKVAFAPLLLIWFGFGINSKIVMACLVAFFPMLMNVIEGMRSADAQELDMLRAFGAGRLQVLRLCKLPNAMPLMFAGLNIGIIFAILGAVVGEYVGAQAGLGYRLLSFNFNFDIAGMFAIMVVLSALGFTSHIIITILRRRFVFWADAPQLANV
jgi:NitT/TauT family transport system permease protein